MEPSSVPEEDKGQRKSHVTSIVKAVLPPMPVQAITMGSLTEQAQRVVELQVGKYCVFY